MHKWLDMSKINTNCSLFGIKIWDTSIYGKKINKSTKGFTGFIIIGVYLMIINLVQ